MDPRDVIYFTEHRYAHFQRERARRELVRQARLNDSRPALIFRIFPSLKRASAPTTD